VFAANAAKWTPRATSASFGCLNLMAEPNRDCARPRPCVTLNAFTSSNEPPPCTPRDESLRASGTPAVSKSRVKIRVERKQFFFEKKNQKTFAL
jgi:hypothetical protein